MARSNKIKLKQILRDAKRLSCEYYELTQKPLGVTGEVAEYEAAQKLHLDLTTARNPGFDASGRVGGKIVRYQIKGRAVSASKKIQRPRSENCAYSQVRHGSLGAA
jgi:hypothetical protein